MDKCPNCGNSLSSIDVLCPRCGAFVEVVQVNNNSASNHSTPDNQNTGSNNSEKKEYPKEFPNLIVYNDDLPPEGDLNEPLESDNDTNNDAGDEIVKDDTVITPDTPKDDPDSTANMCAQFDDVLKDIGGQCTVEDGRQPDAPASAPAEPQSREVVLPKTAPQDESTYTEDYLETIRRMKLPDIDSVDDFDPEEFMREYRRKRNAYNHIPSEAEEASEADVTSDDITTAPTLGDTVEPSTLKRQWLEIEEVDKTPAIAESETAVIDTLEEPEDVTSDFEETPREPEKVTRRSSYASNEREIALMNASSEPVLAEFAQKPESENFFEQQRRRSDRRDSNEEKSEVEEYTPSGTVQPVPVKKRSRAMKIVLTALIWVVVAGALFYGFFLFDGYVMDTYGGYDSFIKDITGGKIDTNTNSAYLNAVDLTFSETQNEDGRYAHLFSINAPEGDSVSILPLGISYALDDGFADILITDESLFSSLKTITYQTPFYTNDVMLEITSNSATYQYGLKDLALFLYTAEYSRQQPLQSVSTTAGETIDVLLTIPQDAVVYINDTDYSDNVDAQGRLSAQLPLKVGQNAFTVDIRQPGKAAKKDTFSVIKQNEDTTLIPDSKYARIFNNADGYTSFGSTNPDASVSASFESGDVFTAKVNEDGRYELPFTLETIGYHDVVITASSPYRPDITVMIGIELLPIRSDFVASAQEYGIDKVLRNASSLGDTPISISGQAKNTTDDSKKQSFTLTASDGSLPCYYYGMTTIDENSIYTLYGIYDADAAAFYVMFVI